MEVKINGEDPLKYGKVPMNADHRLDTDKLRFPYALQSFQSGFNLLINGSSGSGKTTLLCQLLNAKNDKKNGIRRSFKKIFDNVVIVSPSLKTLKDNIFDGLKHKYKTWDEETIEKIEELLDENDDLDDDEDPQIGAKKDEFRRIPHPVVAGHLGFSHHHRGNRRACAAENCNQACGENHCRWREPSSKRRSSRCCHGRAAASPANQDHCVSAR